MKFMERSLLHFRKQQQLAPDFTSRFLSKKSREVPSTLDEQVFLVREVKSRPLLLKPSQKDLYSTSNNQTIQYFDNLLGISYPNLIALGWARMFSDNRISSRRSVNS